MPGKPYAVLTQADNPHICDRIPRPRTARDLDDVTKRAPRRNGGVFGVVAVAQSGVLHEGGGVRQGRV